MIRVFLDGAPVDLPDDTRAMTAESDGSDAEDERCERLLAATYLSSGRAANTLADLVDDGEVWILHNGAPRLVRVESWRKAAKRPAAERDAERLLADSWQATAKGLARLAGKEDR